MVFLVGLLITLLLAIFVLGMEVGDINKVAFWRRAGVLALFPAMLAAIPVRYALSLVGVAGLLCGYWVWELSYATNDGGMGMAIVGMVSFVFISYALIVVALRHTLFKGSRA
ncbi:MAG: hypothetical protein JY451_07350 [Erythrobacter sp.]|nr:MAG: hypothetical protein JY451_07350 [Erythrobacter sp.]